MSGMSNGGLRSELDDLDKIANDLRGIYHAINLLSDSIISQCDNDNDERAFCVLLAVMDEKTQEIQQQASKACRSAYDAHAVKGP